MDYNYIVYSYDILIFGDNFYPKNILQKIQGDFIIDDDYHCPDDNRFGDDDKYGYGSMIISHPLQWTVGKHIIQYEKDFIEFIEKNYKLFKENGVDDIRIFMEVFYDKGGQCNFEIFNKTLLKRLAKYNVSLPISVYTLSKREIKKWEKEINIKWNAGNAPIRANL
ncbi:MAG: hypothetical protein LBS50_10375 [Prevotellaceae bacterium]|jgi:hypothetical protein|nr:hypothetical protein [Prevotellaceae bacterium]